MVGGFRGQKSHPIKLKYCYSCNLYRPPRAVHCGECDACIAVMDHHCPFVSNCIGGRNYGLFFSYVTFLLLNSVMVLIDSACELARRSKEADGHFMIAIKRHPVLLMLCIFNLIISFLLSTLWGYHCRLALNNETTNEVVKKVNARFRQNPNETGSKAANFSARVSALAESAPWFKPLALYKPIPYVGPE